MPFLSNLFQDGPEYEQRKRTPFIPPKATLPEIHAAVPRHLHAKNTVKGLSFIVRDGTLAIFLYKMAWHIPDASSLIAQRINDTGLFLLVPYFSWKSSHSAHHKATVSMERDVNYMPPTRSGMKLPPEPVARSKDYHKIFEETPIYTFYRMFLKQTLGLLAYFAFNKRGSLRHAGASHFHPNSALFKPHERNGVIASDVGLIAMLIALSRWTSNVGFWHCVALYLVPWMNTNHWIIALTFLHHSDPTIPYYRGDEWSFLRGALATVDRPLLGWIGRVFFHNVSHNHVSHHIFSDIPFYNQPEATAHIKKVLKDDYNFDSTNTFRALYRNFVECEFVEDEGNIVFYKNREGKAARHVAATPVCK
ncbi:hypothetical protein PQX77_009531 [Marasmius sp. AFHP31]|nr:hypothetical protein PQX77_009531 [Marasmius sp. AFHP31]